MLLSILSFHLFRLSDLKTDTVQSLKN
jgi:hypothetical protein